MGPGLHSENLSTKMFPSSKKPKDIKHRGTTGTRREFLGGPEAVLEEEKGRSPKAWLGTRGPGAKRRKLCLWLHCTPPHTHLLKGQERSTGHGIRAGAVLGGDPLPDVLGQRAPADIRAPFITVQCGNRTSVFMPRWALRGPGAEPQHRELGEWRKGACSTHI